MNEIEQALGDHDTQRVRALLEADAAALDAPGVLGNRPLHIAAYSGQVDLVELFLRKGADVNARGDMNMTPLHYAAKENEPVVAEILAKWGADLAPVDDWGITPLYRTVQGCFDITDMTEAGKVLLKQGVRVDLNAAVWFLTASQLRERLESEPDAISRAPMPEMLVFDAVIRGDLAVLSVLLQHGALVNGTERYRPLDCALRPGILQKLLEHGADVNVVNSWGETALQVAVRHGADSTIQDLLRRHGATG